MQTLAARLADTRLGKEQGLPPLTAPPPIEEWIRERLVDLGVESGADLRKLQPSAIAPILRGRHLCALYFLWPVMAQDGDVEQSGMVNQADYFATVRAFEASGDDVLGDACVFHLPIKKIELESSC